MTHLETQYLAAGGNRHPAAADWNENGVLAFGADRNIALWQPQVWALRLETNCTLDIFSNNSSPVLSHSRVLTNLIE